MRFALDLVMHDYKKTNVKASSINNFFILSNVNSEIFVASDFETNFTTMNIIF